MKEHRDLLNQQIVVNDLVFCKSTTGNFYVIAKVVKLTPLGVTVEPIMSYSGFTGTKFNMAIDKVIKINEQVQIAKDSSPEFFV